jgi:hypothetical protein
MKNFKLDNEELPIIVIVDFIVAAIVKCNFNQVPCPVDITQSSVNLPEKKLPSFSADAL